MCTQATLVPSNVYVNLDRTLPLCLKLKQGQNLIFIREFSCAGGPFLHSLKMPEPCFVTAPVSHGVRFPGQPEATYVLGLGLVNSAGKGEILIEFDSQSPCTAARFTKRLPFNIE